MIKNQKLSAVRVPTLAEALLYSLMTPSTATSAVTKAALVVFGSLLLAASAQFKIPLYPVPVTGQTLPLLSSGGSAAWVTCIAFGIILSVSQERFNQEKKLK